MFSARKSENTLGFLACPKACLIQAFLASVQGVSSKAEESQWHCASSRLCWGCAEPRRGDPVTHRSHRSHLYCKMRSLKEHDLTCVFI